MSYILDALRKSEQQRQALKPDTINERILLDNEVVKQPRSPWLIPLLSVNLLFIGWVGWFYFQTKTTPLPTKMQNVSHVDEIVEQPVTLKPVSPPYNGKQGTDSALSSRMPKPNTIEEMVALKQQDSKILSRAAQVGQPVVEPVKPDLKPTVLIKKQHKPIGEKRIEKPAALASKQGIVAVDELPSGIRNNLPKLAINVFSYAYQPEQRFVVINMVKYHIGQQINGTVTLVEILPDHVVLMYEGIRFRVERP